MPRTARRRLNTVLVLVLTAVTVACSPPAAGSPFVVGRAQFEKAFPDRNPFSTYDGLVVALGTYPAFATQPYGCPAGTASCYGRGPVLVQNGVDAYLRSTVLLGVAPGENLSC